MFNAPYSGGNAKTMKRLIRLLSSVTNLIFNVFVRPQSDSVTSFPQSHNTFATYLSRKLRRYTNFCIRSHLLCSAQFLSWAQNVSNEVIPSNIASFSDMLWASQTSRLRILILIRKGAPIGAVVILSFPILWHMPWCSQSRLTLHPLFSSTWRTPRGTPASTPAVLRPPYSRWSIQQTLISRESISGFFGWRSKN